MGEITRPRPLMVEDDRLAFDCGKASLNLWFQRHAWKNQKSGVSRTNVLCDASTGNVVAFISLTTAEIYRQYLPRPQQRNKPDPVPAILLGQLAVDLNYQKQGLAKSLLFFAFKTAINISENIGCYCLITHPINETASAFYEHWGFEDIPYAQSKTMMIRIADLKQSGFLEE